MPSQTLSSVAAGFAASLASVTFAAPPPTTGPTTAPSGPTPAEVREGAILSSLTTQLSTYERDLAAKEILHPKDSKLTIDADIARLAHPSVELEAILLADANKSRTVVADAVLARNTITHIEGLKTEPERDAAAQKFIAEQDVKTAKLKTLLDADLLTINGLTANPELKTALDAASAPSIKAFEVKVEKGGGHPVTAAEAAAAK